MPRVESKPVLKSDGATEVPHLGGAVLGFARRGLILRAERDQVGYHLRPVDFTKAACPPPEVVILKNGT